MAFRILSQRLQCHSLVPISVGTKLARFSSKNEPEIPKNTLGNFYSAVQQKNNGKIYDKKPFKITLKAGKTYGWCLCGQSKNQPFCDGTHKDIFLKITLRPIIFKVDKDKDYWLCNCKQTRNRPFCDGTHKTKDVQEAPNVRV